MPKRAIKSRDVVLAVLLGLLIAAASSGHPHARPQASKVSAAPSSPAAPLSATPVAHAKRPPAGLRRPPSPQAVRTRSVDAYPKKDQQRDSQLRAADPVPASNTSSSWFIVMTSVVAIVVSICTITFTARGLHLRSRRLDS